jgi:DMSO reductase family type II enzyme chaperone
MKQARNDTSTSAGESALVLLLLSRLTGSPHDWDEAMLEECCSLLDAALLAVEDPALRDALSQLKAQFQPAEAGWQPRVASGYSALFEVGTAGPPLPIREELTASAAGGSKEEVVRFYEMFGYSVQPHFEWAPDHLSLLLEFAAWLAGLESGAATADDTQSLRCAQRDLLERHLAHWVPALAVAVRSFAPQGFHASVLHVLDLFLAQQRARLAAAEA